MSNSKRVNSINFYIILILAVIFAFIISVIRTGGLESLYHLNSAEFSGFIGVFLGVFSMLFGMPLLVAWCCAVTIFKLKKKNQYNLSYILVWMVFLFLTFNTFAQPQPQPNPKLIINSFHKGFTKSCLIRVAKLNSQNLNKINAVQYCKNYYLSIKPIATSCLVKESFDVCMQNKFSILKQCMEGNESTKINKNKCIEEAIKS